ncbi:MAG: HAD family hydrolase [Lachnospiraceae bacterium]|nr:HAD family hydrolase [Lachnospiraceae bacterium]
MKMEGIIFDVDGTLWDSTGIVADAWNHAIAQAGIEGKIVTATDLKKLFGKTMKVIAEELLPKQSETKRKEIMDLCCEYEHAALMQNEQDITYQNVSKTIQELAKQYKLFIVSNCQSGYIELFLDKTGLHSYITDIECYGNTGRPKGDNIRLVVERNHLLSAVYVGDTAGDYEAAQQAEVPMIFAEYGFGELPENSEVYAIIHTFADLMELF